MVYAKKNGDHALHMSKGNRASVYLLHTLFWLWLTVNSSEGVLSDILCLKGIKQQLTDSDGSLYNWDFSNKTEGFICQFDGIECWHPDESKVLNIRLPNMGLRGRFPSALRNCSSLTGLDLSANELSGPLPEDIGRIIPFATHLDLSSNNFAGVIPTNLSNCSYLNTLKLQRNHFTGQIPWQLGRLDRLAEFSVADNGLSGQIPSFEKSMPESSFANNLGLCGKPLATCGGPPKKSKSTGFFGATIGAAIGGVIGGLMLAIIAIGAILSLVVRKAAKTEEEQGRRP